MGPYWKMNEFVMFEFFFFFNSSQQNPKVKNPLLPRFFIIKISFNQSYEQPNKNMNASNQN